MALFFGIPSCHPYSYRCYRTPQSYGLFSDLGGLMALSQDLIEKPWFPEQQRQRPNSPRTIRIGQIPLGHYRPEDISIAVEGDQITAHGKHRLESENGFECSEFKKRFKLPGEVDPASVTSRGTRDGFLVIQGKQRVVEEKHSDDSKFELTFDLRGFDPDDIEIKLQGKELKVSAKQTAEDEAGNWSRGYSMSRHIVLPDDVDPSSVSSKLSKEGLLSIEANRNPALVARERTVEISREAIEPGNEQDPEEAGIADKPQEN